MDAFEVLGQTIVKQATGGVLVVGDAPKSGGFDSSFLISAASELAQRGVDQYQSSEADKKTKADQAVQVTKAIAADANWASAEATLDIANQSHDASRIAPA